MKGGDGKMQRHDDAKEVRTPRVGTRIHQEQIALAHWRALSHKRKKTIALCLTLT